MGLGRPVSRILLYPAIHLRGIPGPLCERLRLPARNASRRPGQFGLLAPVVCLAGPSRDAAGGLLPHPFTHHLCRREAPRPSAGLLSVALDVTGGLRPSAPRVVGPSGLCYESGLCSTPLAEAPGRSDGSDGPNPLGLYLTGYMLGSGRRMEPPRRTSTILVGVRRSSTLWVLSQRLRQRGSSRTSGSNQTPGPAGSSTPS